MTVKKEAWLKSTPFDFYVFLFFYFYSIVNLRAKSAYLHCISMATEVSDVNAYTYLSYMHVINFGWTENVILGDVSIESRLSHTYIVEFTCDKNCDA